MISKRSCVSENWNNNSALHYRNNIAFYNILKLETFFLFVLIFHNIAVFLPKSNKFSLDEQKIFISESLIVMFPNFWQVF